MNRNEHFTIAFVLLIVFFFLLNFLHLLRYAGFATVLLIGSVLPDIIEPAKHYTHRNFFHSKRFLKGLYYSLLPLLLVGILANIVLFGFFLVIGYISHLWLDSTTPMGLPN